MHSSRVPHLLRISTWRPPAASRRPQARRSTSPDHTRHDGEECLTVVKNGNTTGITIGRATGIESSVREYDNYGIRSTSTEVAIYPYPSPQDGAFSATGDSGPVIAEVNSRIVDILTSGAGQRGPSDVTHASPYYWVKECVKKAFPSSYPYPIMT